VNRKTAKKVKLILGAAVVVIFLSIGISAMQDFVNPYKGVTEVASNYNGYKGKSLQVQGYVVEETIDWNPEQQRLQFDLTDDGGGIIHVTYEGLLPGTFPVERDIGSESRIDVVAIGELESPGAMRARQILVKCPSKYEQELEE
jgi:cytochrome c-type biogenesis protein CcmE